MRGKHICNKELIELGENSDLYFRDTIIQEQMLLNMEILKQFNKSILH